MTVDKDANEAAMRFLASEVQRLELMLAQALGNLTLANKRIAELEGSNELRTNGLPESSDLHSSGNSTKRSRQQHKERLQRPHRPIDDH